MSTHLTKKEWNLKFLSEYQLKHRYIDKYKHLKAVGYSEKLATKLLRKDASMSSLAKLKDRTVFASNQFGTTGISLQGIRITDDVKDYIKDLEDRDVILPHKKGQDILYLKHPKVWER